MFACALCLRPAAGIPSPGECWPPPAPAQERGVINLRTEGEGLQGDTLLLQVVGAAGQTRAGCWLREPSSESSPSSKLSRESERTCVRSAVRSKKASFGRKPRTSLAVSSQGRFTREVRGASGMEGKLGRSGSEGAGIQAVPGGLSSRGYASFTHAVFL